MTGQTVNLDLSSDDEAQLSRSKDFTLGDLLRKNARTRMDELAVVGEDGQELTYQELNERTNRLATSLLERGYEYGDTIAVVSENRPEFVEIYYAGAKLGMPVAAMNWRLVDSELLHCLEVVDADLVIVSGNNSEKVEWIRDNDGHTPEIIGLDEVIPAESYETVLDEGEPSEPTPTELVTPEDIAAVLYTSGTTGLPKGAAISHRAFVNRGLVMQVLGVVSTEYPDIVAWPPMFHMASADPLFGVGLVGGTYYTVDGHDCETVFERTKQADSAWLIMMPSTIQQMLDYVSENQIDVTSDLDVSFIGSQADLVAPNKIREATEVLDARFINTFGSTETGLPPATGNSFGISELPGERMLKTESPLCDVKLVDDEWDEVSRGVRGELAIRGPTLFSGYVGNKEANSEDFNNGWFRGGDMFIRHSDGRLEFVDRRKYLIKSGGENIYPAEIEKALMEHEEVDEAIAVRVPDDEWGEVPKAYLAASDTSDLSRGDVLEYLDGKIARYKLPHYVEFIDQADLPRSTSGKIERSTVEEWSVSSDERVRGP